MRGVVSTRANFSRRWEGFWRLADPKISLASMSSIFIGAAAAWRHGSLDWSWFLLTVAGIFCLEVAKNASGELFDFDTDSAVRPEDRSPFSGGKRVLVDNLLTRWETAVIAATGYALGITCGLLIVAFRSTDVFWWGLVGVACAFFYNAPPLKLSYRGLGEVAVALCYGPLIATGTFLVQRGSLSRDVVLVSIPLGLLIGAFLWINEFPDSAADRAARKYNLVVRLGRLRASRIFAGIVAIAFALLVLLPFFGLPFTIWLGALALPFALAAVRTLWRYPETTARIIPAQAKALLAFVVLAIGVGIGLAIPR
jgi:1,4-dihydroxy-2-naphthoate polyprenyltransferase